MRRPRWLPLIRDLFLGGVALFVLWTQLPVDGHGPAQAILIFLVIFLFGSIPALRGDSRPGHYGPFVRIIMAMMGVQFPDSFEDAEDGSTVSGPDTRKPSGSPGSAGSGPQSPR